MQNGKYIVFIDCDDYVAEDMIMVLHNDITSSNSDMSICSFCIQENSKIRKAGNNKRAKLMNRRIFLESLRDSDYKGYLWNKMFKKEIITNNNIRFEENREYCEDLIFTLHYSRKCDQFIYNPANLYYYRIHSSSAMNSKNKNRKKNEITAIADVIKILKEIDESNAYFKYESMYILMGFDYMHKNGNDKLIKKNIESYIKEGCIKRERKLGIKAKIIIYAYIPVIAAVLKKIKR